MQHSWSRRWFFVPRLYQTIWSLSLLECFFLHILFLLTLHFQMKCYSNYLYQGIQKGMCSLALSKCQLIQFHAEIELQRHVFYQSLIWNNWLHITVWFHAAKSSFLRCPAKQGSRGRNITQISAWKKFSMNFFS